MQLENVIAQYRHLPFLPKRRLYRHLVNWTERNRNPNQNLKTALIKLDNSESFHINVDINTWLGKEVFYFGKFELFTYRFFLKNIFAGSIVVDAGANIGFYSLMSAALADVNGAVHSFEPTTKFYSKLQDNLKLNAFRNIALNKKALGNENRKLFIDVREQTASVSADGVGEEVEQITLDQYFINQPNGPNLIKVDVDGHELPILEGSKQTIEQYKPMFCVEVSRQQDDTKLIFDYLSEADYRIFKDNNPNRPIDFEEVKILFEKVNGFNLIAIHKDANYRIW